MDVMGLCELGLPGGETEDHQQQPGVSMMYMSSESGLHLERRPGPLHTNGLTE